MKVQNPQINGKYPPANGFIGKRNETLPINKIIHRYGAGGKYFADPETSFEERALPVQGEDFYYKIIEQLPVEKGRVIPWFGQPGRGIQYKTSESVQKMKGRYIEDVTNENSKEDG